MKAKTSKSKTSKSKTTRKSTLSAATLHKIYKPAAQIAWISIFQNRAKSAKSPADRKMYLAKAKAQLAKLNASTRARYRELQAA